MEAVVRDTPQLVILVYSNSQMVRTDVRSGHVSLRDIPRLLQTNKLVFINYDTKKDITIQMLLRYFATYGKHYSFTDEESKILYKILVHRIAEYGAANKGR